MIKSTLIKFIAIIMVLLCVVRCSYALSDATSTLLSNTNLTAEVTNGTTRCMPHNAEDFVFYLKASDTGGSTPTLDVVAYHSDDEVTWFPLVTFTQVETADSTQVISVNPSTTHVLKCIRVTATIGGTSTPGFNVVSKMFYRQR